MRTRLLQRPGRRGITLVELLVVMLIVAALATLVMAVAPRFGERQRASQGASTLQCWLNLTKQWAVRDQRPRGIRLPYPSTDPGLPAGVSYIRAVMFIEQPDDFTGGTLIIPNNNSDPSPNRYNFVRLTGVTITGLPPTAGVVTSRDPSAAIQIGDVIDIFELFPNQPRRIVDAFESGSPGDYVIQLDQELIPGPNYPSMPPPSTGSYRIYRKARPMQGEPVLQLPRDVAIDVSRESTTTAGVAPKWYRLFPASANSLAQSPFDILFNPAGQVIGPEATLGNRICLWVRDVAINDPRPTFPAGSDATDPTKLPPGDNTLITIYTKTGQVAAHPVDPSGLVPNSASDPNSWNPFRFTVDAKSSGQH
jgi:prepilin-type N-terminal cleavage/methylation domain-containing protein